VSLSLPGLLAWGGEESDRERGWCEQEDAGRERDTHPSQRQLPISRLI
jgi:hypothetical protein